jgi:hypothetical protein
MKKNTLQVMVNILIGVVVVYFAANIAGVIGCGLGKSDEFCVALNATDRLAALPLLFALAASVIIWRNSKRYVQMGYKIQKTMLALSFAGVVIVTNWFLANF